jgi:hypothetical protein
VLNSSDATHLRVQDGVRPGEVIFPYLIGNELVTGDGRPKRYLIDFQPRSLIEAQKYHRTFKRIENTVLPDRIKKLEEGRDAAGNARPHHRRFLDAWWRLSWERGDMVEAMSRLRGRFIVCSRVTKRPIFAFVSTSIRPGDRLQTFMFDDDYSFGILQSSAHWEWFVARCPKQTERFIYSPEEVFDSFPWPQAPSTTDVEQVAEAGRRIRKIRDKYLIESRGGLRALYRSLELPGKNPLREAHGDLNNSTLKAFGFSGRADLLLQLLEVNKEIEGRLVRGESPTGPGLPLGYKSVERVMSEDCISAIIGGA